MHTINLILIFVSFPRYGYVYFIFLDIMAVTTCAMTGCNPSRDTSLSQYTLYRVNSIAKAMGITDDDLLKCSHPCSPSLTSEGSSDRR